MYTWGASECLGRNPVYPPDGGTGNGGVGGSSGGASGGAGGGVKRVSRGKGSAGKCVYICVYKRKCVCVGVSDDGSNKGSAGECVLHSSAIPFTTI